MKNLAFFSLLSLCISLACCHSTSKVDDLNTIPTVTEKDEKLANVYQLLDGKWKGQFKIYEDKNRQSKKSVDLKNISINNLNKKGIEQVGYIEVEQIYTSETPYFQSVVITDYYPDQDKSVIAKGVNKIIDGKLICVVIKPDDTVIHDGYLENKNTIIWQRHIHSPQKVEYFRETVDDTSYEIVGWGYYDNDDLRLSPKFWFHGKYERQY